MKVKIIGAKQSTVDGSKYCKLFVIRKNPIDTDYTKSFGLCCSEVSVPLNIYNLVVSRAKELEIVLPCTFEDFDFEFCLDADMDYDPNGKLLEFTLIS